MKKYTKSELCLIWLDSFLGLEYKHKSELYKKINDSTEIKKFLSDNKDYIESAIGQKEYSTLLGSANAEYLRFVMDGLASRGINALTIVSEDYPQGLKEVNCPPLVLYYKGEEKLLHEKNTFSIVGSRKNIPLSISLAKSYASALIDAGVTLVTGIAEGVDTAVLESAVQNKKGAISVIAGGFDNIYPKSNIGLMEEVIKSGGLVLSEFPPTVVPMPYHFPVRNRIIAGLGKGVLVVSGGQKSGTLYTADYAVELSKEVFCLPYSVGISCGAGCNDLIKRGASLTDSPKDILNFYGWEEKEKQKIELSAQEKDIVKALSNGELHIDKIAKALDKQSFMITPILSILEIKGIVVKSGNVFGLARKDLEV